MNLPKPFGGYIYTHAFLQALFFVPLFFSVLNMAYTVMVVAFVRSWLLSWWIDRRFPFNVIPLWMFFLVSLAAFIVGIYYYPTNRPKLGFDRANGFLLGIAIGLIAWIVFALSLTHTFYIGDFNVFRIMQNFLSGRHILELPVETIDVFPTLGDTVLIGYVFAFFFLFLASWRAFRTVPKKRQILMVIGKPNPKWM